MTITREEIEQEIFDTYTTFPDKDVSFEFNQGVIYAMRKYDIINTQQADIFYKYNKNLWLNFE